MKLRIFAAIFLFLLCTTSAFAAIDYDQFLIDCFAGRERAVRNAVQDGADVNYREPKEGLTPLMFASMGGNNQGVAYILLNNGADINFQAYNGYTAVMCATISDAKWTTEMLEYLLRCGADPNIVSKDGYTALAIARAKNYPSKVRILKQYGAK